MKTNTTLISRLLAFADDELILAHRNSEWVGHAPILEEDIALANITQDELGHAKLFYDLIKELNNSDPDQLVYQRDAKHYRSTQMVELPKGDWAFTMIRQFLFDAYEVLLYQGLSKSSYQPLADATNKMLREDKFHLQHSKLWLERLGLGSKEANLRSQKALNELWSYVFQLFDMTEEDETLAQEGLMPNLTELKHNWLALVIPEIEDAELHIPDSEPLKLSRTERNEHFEELIHDLQSVARTVPAEVW